MKRTITALAVGVALAAGGMTLAVAQPALATETPTCPMPTGWYANADEQDRLPTPVTGGLEFSGNDLIHHATTGEVETLSPGLFTAAPAPDQASFFSVEVSGSDGGYGTLRWNVDTGKWNLTTGGQFYENVLASALVDMPPVHRSHHVVSFGVGYTNSPPGTVTTTVKSVAFGGHTYDLACKTASPSPSASSASPTPKPSQSATPSHSPSTTAGPVATATSPGDAGGLPVTGPNLWVFALAGVAFLFAGVGAVLLSQRHRRTFTP